MTVLAAAAAAPIVELLALVLADAGYTVVRADDGAAARAVLEDARPDLLISDSTRPRLSGLDLAAWVRAREGDGAALPIALISAVARARRGDAPGHRLRRQAVRPRPRSPGGRGAPAAPRGHLNGTARRSSACGGARSSGPSRSRCTVP